MTDAGDLSLHQHMPTQRAGFFVGLQQLRIIDDVDTDAFAAIPVGGFDHDGPAQLRRRVPGFVGAVGPHVLCRWQARAAQQAGGDLLVRAQPRAHGGILPAGAAVHPLRLGTPSQLDQP